jgi:hypothetical protein
MTPYSQRFMFRLLGISRELECLKTEAEQRAAYQLISRRVWSGRIRMAYLWTGGLAFAVLSKPIIRYVDAILKPTSVMPPWLFELLVFLGIGLVIGVLYYWFTRHRHARELRAYLIEKGVATCMSCGYNLTGATEPRCPECGSSRA